MHRTCRLLPILLCACGTYTTTPNDFAPADFSQTSTLPSDLSVPDAVTEADLAAPANDLAFATPMCDMAGASPGLLSQNVIHFAGIGSGGGLFTAHFTPQAGWSPLTQSSVVALTSVSLTH